MKSLLLLAATAKAQDYCTSNKHKVDVTQLPYQVGDLHECQYAGTLKTKKETFKEGHNLFYWYFKHPDPDAPLLLWLNGGPGATSMFGLFLENGPLRVKRTGDGSDDFELYAAENSWADSYNLIFLDQPVGTGFSYGDSYLTSMQ